MKSATKQGKEAKNNCFTFKIYAMETNKLSFPEIVVQYKDTDTEKRPEIIAPGQAKEVLMPYFDGCMQHHEEAWVIYLSSRNRVLGVSCISKGGLETTLVDIRMILQIALKTNSTGIILSHNHPGGSHYPSKDDNNMTIQLKKACVLLNIELLDHLILTENSYYSYADEGEL